MKSDSLIRVWGLFDVTLLIWIFVRDALSGKVPFFSDFAENFRAAQGFEEPFLVIGDAIVSTVMLTIIISGPLQILLRKMGVFLSLLQFPFRLFLFIPPTAFFLSSLNDYAPQFVLFSMIVAIEIIKTSTQIVWIRKHKLLVKRAG